ncbi:anhydro-N-acetylmuramic acid kinase [Agromyces hippuratus]|uniref:Anhydro-N-acetylmuramic acid kinase n=1 Tax=Agromyces hippuratus TaxID=286438 RepID=A0A852X2U6_9MICO|nr:anhydro-N-acetylmuramic acid kinase [Agromyces hippuratus]NYG22463.1 anhydro-N-acetylmuramic acid kinase [Agromyces hippuratus]
MMRVLGMISGTSHDGIDVAVVEFTERDGVLSGRVLHDATTPYAPALRERLIAALPPAPTTLAEICELDTLIGQAFADAALAARDAVGGVDAVTSHGQTVYHWVDGAHALGTLQIGQPAWIAELLGVPVVSDVRIRDIVAGGHGAPLVSFLDELLLRDRSGVSAALNLGGISNMTVVGEDALVAYDIGPSNALVDAVVVDEGLNDLGYDDDARIASTGTVDEELLALLLADPYYALTAPKSTGKEHFHLAYVRDAEARLGRSIEVDDLVRTLTELTVQTVARDVRAAGIGFLAASGGGCRNPLILDGLRAALPEVEVVLADELGAPADSKEAIAFALIGWCTLHGIPATVPGGTGASAPRILGTITPGDGPLVLPQPVDGLRSLVLEAGR